MPIMNCRINNRKGFKFGKSGKCYRNKSQALKQMRAIKANQGKKSGK